jgi:hypothetical protein
MSWSRRFDDPIPTPNGKPLLTLKDAAAYIMALPNKEADTVEWQAAIEALMLVAESGGPTMFARIVMQQLAVLTLRKASRIMSNGVLTFSSEGCARWSQAALGTPCLSLSIIRPSVHYCTDICRREFYSYRIELHGRIVFSAYA